MNEQSSPQAAPRRGRIIVTVDADSHLPPTIELAVTLAAATQSTLHGLFVQDIDLLMVARLPFAQEVPLLGGRPRSLDDQALQRSLEKFADQFRQVLESQARRFALNCSYSVVQGRKHHMELGDAGQAELFVLGQPRRGGPRSAGLHRYVLFADHCEEMLPALEILLEQHRGMHNELVLLSKTGRLEGGVQHLLGQILARHPGVVSTILPVDQLHRILGAQSPRVDCVITSAHMGDDEMREVLRLASCPVIIAKAAVPGGEQGCSE
jgi:nucleotide-binding universal stress UspA family protein